MKFLIIDSSRTMRHIVRGLLNEIGYGAEVAEDGTVALRFLRTQQFDFVIADINMAMTKTDGLELLKVIKTDADLKDLPVLMVTATPFCEQMSYAAENGAPSYIVKPFTKDALEKKIMEVLQKNAPH